MNGGLGPDMKPSPAMTAFSKVNDEWIASMQSLAKQSTVADKAYWHHVDLINLQMRGVWDGYTTAAKGSKGKLPELKWESILYMNLGDELGDVGDVGALRGDGDEAGGGVPLAEREHRAVDRDGARALDAHAAEEAVDAEVGDGRDVGLLEQQAVGADARLELTPADGDGRRQLRRRREAGEHLGDAILRRVREAEQPQPHGLLDLLRVALEGQPALGHGDPALG